MSLCPSQYGSSAHLSLDVEKGEGKGAQGVMGVVLAFQLGTN